MKGVVWLSKGGLINHLEDICWVEVRLLDTFPHYGELGPREILALGGFGTVLPKDFLQIYEEFPPEEIDRRVKDILHGAVARGYASITTSTALLFLVRGSRILDLFTTSFPFGSYMVLSQRYVPAERPEVPRGVDGSVRDLLREEIRVYRELLDLGIAREEARGVLGLGTPSHFLAVFPVETAANLIRWGGEHPEIEGFLRRMEEEVLNSDVAEVFRATINAPTMGGPFPHPFHRRRLEAPEEISVVSYSWDGKKKGVREYRRVMEHIRKNPPRTWREAVENTHKLSKIAFSHINEFWVSFSGRIPLTTFNELKRHRTIPLEVEGIYNAMERGEFYIYPSVKNNQEARGLYEWVIEQFRSLEAGEYERIYALPQSVRIGVRFSLNFAHLTAPSMFYRIRSCDRAEISMKQLVRQIPYIIRREVPDYGEALFPLLATDRGPIPKCVIGACPEPKHCPLIGGMNPRYDHKQIKRSRKEVLG